MGLEHWTASDGFSSSLWEAGDAKWLLRAEYTPFVLSVCLLVDFGGRSGWSWIQLLEQAEQWPRPHSVSRWIQKSFLLWFLVPCHRTWVREKNCFKSQEVSYFHLLQIAFCFKSNDILEQSISTSWLKYIWLEILINQKLQIYEYKNYLLTLHSKINFNIRNLFNWKIL